VNIQTVQFAHILETSDLEALHDFLSHTAFVISHKSESVETLLKVLWYIPVNSTIIIVTNCQERDRDDLARALKTRLAHHRKAYLIHQKDEHIAGLFTACGVSHILGTDGKVLDGKGEGMYIGALCAYQLGYPRWTIFYDADNFVPSALLEYTLAMCRLFMSAPFPAYNCEYDSFVAANRLFGPVVPDLHNVRICWSSKPDIGNRDWETRVMGRTTRVVSPLFNDLLAGWFGIHNHPISSSNAGEQGMTVKAASSLRFSSGFSVETFQLLDLLFHATEWKGRSGEIIFQQYLSQSPHFHEKKGDEHIKRMIEESLGSFAHFEAVLPDNVKRHLEDVYHELQLEYMKPAVYPALRDLPLCRFAPLMDRYALFTDTVHQGKHVADTHHRELLATGANHQVLTIADTNHQDLMFAGVASQELLMVDTNHQDLLINDANRQELLVTETNSEELLIADASPQNLLIADTNFQNFLGAD
jgi:mannosyl-3-phosphoglycerate synthase